MFTNFAIWGPPASWIPLSHYTPILKKQKNIQACGEKNTSWPSAPRLPTIRCLLAARAHVDEKLLPLAAQVPEGLEAWRGGRGWEVNIDLGSPGYFLYKMEDMEVPGCPYNPPSGYTNRIGWEFHSDRFEWDMIGILMGIYWYNGMCCEIIMVNKATRMVI